MGLIIFIAYVLLMMIISIRIGKRGGEDSFYVNNRSSSATLVAFSIVASCVGASATIGTVGLAFKVGTPAFWWLGSGAVGLSVLTIFLAKKVRQSHVYTLPEMVINFFGVKARCVVSIIIVVAWTSILAAQFTAISWVIQSLTGFEHLTSLLLGAVLISAHTFFSGQSGVLKLDRIQCLIILTGLVLIAIWLANFNPTAIGGIKFEVINDKFPLSRVIYFLVVLGGSYVVCPMLFGRLLSAKNEKAAHRGALQGVFGLIFISALIVVIGILSKGLIPAETDSDQVLTAVLATIFPAWLSYAVYLILLSAIISSADSCLITASLILARDLWQNKRLAATRICIVFISLSGILVTFFDKSILGFLLMANDIYVCGVVAPVFIGLMYAKTDKAHEHLVLAAFIVGGVLGLISSITENVYFSYLGVAASSLLTLLSFWIPISPMKVNRPNL